MEHQRAVRRERRVLGGLVGRRTQPLIHPALADPLHQPLQVEIGLGKTVGTQSVEPLTLAETKAFLRLPELSPADTETDDTVTAMITGARAQAEYCQNRDLVRKQYLLSRDAFCGVEIRLRPHLVSVDGFTRRDSDGVITALAEDTDYIVDAVKQPGLVMPPYNGSWPSFTPWPTSAVAIASIPPAAPSRCPVMDLVEETASLRAWSPNTALMAFVSLASLNGVEVPWALM